MKILVLGEERWSKLCIFILCSYRMVKRESPGEDNFNLYQVCSQHTICTQCLSGQQAFPTPRPCGLGRVLLLPCSPGRGCVGRALSPCLPQTWSAVPARWEAGARPQGWGGMGTDPSSDGFTAQEQAPIWVFNRTDHLWPCHL